MAYAGLSGFAVAIHVLHVSGTLVREVAQFCEFIKLFVDRLPSSPSCTLECSMRILNILHTVKSVCIYSLHGQACGSKTVLLRQPQYAQIASLAMSLSSCIRLSWAPWQAGGQKRSQSKPLW